MDNLKLFGRSKKDVEMLMNTVWVFSEAIGMQFGIDECAISVLKRRKFGSQNNDIILGDQERISFLDLDNSNKSLGVLELDNIKHKDMTGKIETEYISQLHNILKSIQQV